MEQKTNNPFIPRETIKKKNIQKDSKKKKEKALAFRELVKIIRLCV